MTLCALKLHSELNCPQYSDKYVSVVIWVKLWPKFEDENLSEKKFSAETEFCKIDPWSAVSVTRPPQPNVVSRYLALLDLISLLHVWFLLTVLPQPESYVHTLYPGPIFRTIFFRGKNVHTKKSSSVRDYQIGPIGWLYTSDSITTKMDRRHLRRKFAENSPKIRRKFAQISQNDSLCLRGVVI
jgi:hypothetical protein